MDLLYFQTRFLLGYKENLYPKEKNWLGSSGSDHRQKAGQVYQKMAAIKIAKSLVKSPFQMLVTYSKKEAERQMPAGYWNSTAFAKTSLNCLTWQNGENIKYMLC